MAISKDVRRSPRVDKRTFSPGDPRRDQALLELARSRLESPTASTNGLPTAPAGCADHGRGDRTDERVHHRAAPGAAIISNGTGPMKPHGECLQLRHRNIRTLRRITAASSLKAGSGEQFFQLAPCPAWLCDGTWARLWVMIPHHNPPSTRVQGASGRTVARSAIRMTAQSSPSQQGGDRPGGVSGFCGHLEAGASGYSMRRLMRCFSSRSWPLIPTWSRFARQRISDRPYPAAWQRQTCRCVPGSPGRLYPYPERQGQEPPDVTSDRGQTHPDEGPALRWRWNSRTEKCEAGAGHDPDADRWESPSVISTASSF
jgi:hypothetical protein